MRHLLLLTSTVTHDVIKFPNFGTPKAQQELWQI